MSDDTITVCIWPDGDWCLLRDKEEEYTWKSDDHLFVEVPANINDPEKMGRKIHKGKQDMKEGIEITKGCDGCLRG